MIWFYAEDIIAWLQLDPNQRYAPLAALCGRLGLSAAAEARRIRGHALLGGGLRRLTLDDDVGPELCLAIELLPLWLSGLPAGRIADPAARARLELFQREAASALWQGFRPQGHDSDDALLPPRHQQAAAEQAYVAAQAIAGLARQQMLIERQLDAPADDDVAPGDPWAARAGAQDDPAAARVAQTVRRIARTLSERTRRNEYHGIYSGLYAAFGIGSYRRMPPARLAMALEWLDRWHGDLLGEPEPPPDI